MKSFIYYHQSLPLYSKRIEFKGHNLKSNIFYCYVYPIYVKLFLNKNTFVAVQTEEIRLRFGKRYHFPLDKIGVFFPDVEKIEVERVDPFEYEKGTFNFVYPSMGATYKEHKTIVKALQYIYDEKPELAQRIRVHFTIRESDNTELYNYICRYHQQGNFVCHGNIPRQQVLSMMRNSEALLFPSVIETLGLPLLEAASMGVRVVANDLGYAHEVLEGYDGVDYVKVHDYERWATVMKDCCINKTHYQHYNHFSNDSWVRLLQQIKGSIDDTHRQVICVLATASAMRGALAIYNQFMKALANYVNDEDWHIFVDMDMPMPEIPHVYYHVCHTKGVGRVWFDFVGFKRLVKKEGIVPGVIFSLQNTGAML